MDVSINNYRFNPKAIGSGVSADVYVAENKDTGELVAIKQFRTKKFPKSVESEIKILQCLKNINIVEIKDVFNDDGYPCIVMEYCNAGNLYNFVKRHKPLSEEDVQYFIKQIANGLKTMKDHDYIHRDLKPENLMLTYDENGDLIIKIIDFGLTKLVEQDQLTQSFVGTPLYMAPETFTDNGYNGKVDLWSLGCILYFCLFGKSPFKGVQSIVQLKKIFSSGKQPIFPFPKTKQISKDCRDLLSSLLQVEPNKRISWKRFFSHPWISGNLNEKTLDGNSNNFNELFSKNQSNSQEDTVLDYPYSNSEEEEKEEEEFVADDQDFIHHNLTKEEESDSHDLLPRSIFFPSLIDTYRNNKKDVMNDSFFIQENEGKLSQSKTQKKKSGSIIQEMSPYYERNDYNVNISLDSKDFDFDIEKSDNSLNGSSTYFDYEFHDNESNDVEISMVNKKHFDNSIFNINKDLFSSIPINYKNPILLKISNKFNQIIIISSLGDYITSKGFLYDGLLVYFSILRDCKSLYQLLSGSSFSSSSSLSSSTDDSFTAIKLKNLIKKHFNHYLSITEIVLNKNPKPTNHYNFQQVLIHHAKQFGIKGAIEEYHQSYERSLQYYRAAIAFFQYCKYDKVHEKYLNTFTYRLNYVKNKQDSKNLNNK